MALRPKKMRQGHQTTNHTYNKKSLDGDRQVTACTGYIIYGSAYIRLKKVKHMFLEWARKNKLHYSIITDI
jgi:hypothetical protein